MTIIENISLIQRIASSIKNEVEGMGAAGATVKAKVEILEGELGIFRQCYDENAAEDQPTQEEAPMPDFMGAMNPTAAPIIDVENPVMADEIVED